MKKEKIIEYSSATRRAVELYGNLLTIHNHPDSFPPSIDDLLSNYIHGYAGGIIVCHDGKVYLYSANEMLQADYYKLVVEGYLKNGYNENESQLMALYELQKNFDIDFREVTDHDGV
ncbi:MAG: hypothetical protein LIO67_04145 [Lachnospiraceae bacterium]|nr:hypothetical protein [Lachnospiraceae bacterium]